MNLYDVTLWIVDAAGDQLRVSGEYPGRDAKEAAATAKVATALKPGQSFAGSTTVYLMPLAVETEAE